MCCETEKTEVTNSNTVVPQNPLELTEQEQEMLLEERKCYLTIKRGGEYISWNASAVWTGTLATKVFNAEHPDKQIKCIILNGKELGDKKTLGLLGDHQTCLHAKSI